LRDMTLRQLVETLADDQEALDMRGLSQEVAEPGRRYQAVHLAKCACLQPDVLRAHGR